MNAGVSISDKDRDPFRPGRGFLLPDRFENLLADRVEGSGFIHDLANAIRAAFATDQLAKRSVFVFRVLRQAISVVIQHSR